MILIQKIKHKIFQWKYKKDKIYTLRDYLKEHLTWEMFWTLFSYTMWDFRQKILDPKFEKLREKCLREFEKELNKEVG